MTSKDYVKGLITIHTTSAANSPHIDFDDIKNLNIHHVENYGSTGTVQLVNNYPVQTENLLSNYCNLWSDKKARKLDRAMFLRIYHDTRTDTNAIGVFLITQINASDGLITLTFCDSVQYLRSVGHDYVKNHYHKSFGWYAMPTKWESGEARLYHPSGAVLYGGSHHDIRMGKMVRKKYETDNEKISKYGSNKRNVYYMFDINFGRNIHALHKMTIRSLRVVASEHKMHNAEFECAIKGGTTYLKEFQINSDGQYHDYTFNFGTNPVIMDKTSTRITITVYDEGHDSNFGMSFGTQTGVSECGITTGDNTPSSQKYYSERAILSDIICSYETDEVVGTNTDTYFKVTTIDGEAPTQESIELVNYPERSWGLFLDPASRISAGTIFIRILAAYGFTCNEFMGRPINLFRCNGDCIHNYLLALADMSNDGRQFAFASSPTDWKSIVVGMRYKKTDQTAFYFYYAYFGAIEGGTPMMSFNPSISMKNRPRMAVVKGTDENKKPIMVAVVDPLTTMGASKMSVNGSVTSPVDGALATYSDIIQNRSEDWQGEIKVSGIHMDYFNGSSVSGVPISITDHRYGFADYKAKIKEITWDFANQTTTIVVNNYSEIYSNAILDTSKMAYSAGDMSAEGTNSDMFLRQFVNLVLTDQTSSGNTARMRIHPITGTEGVITDAKTIDIPELNIRVVNGYFPPGVGSTTGEYAVWDVQVGDKTHEIPSALRPDKYANQSLIVNVIYKLK